MKFIGHQLSVLTLAASFFSWPIFSLAQEQESQTGVGNADIKNKPGLLELLHRQDKSAIIPLRELAVQSRRPVCRIQVLALLTKGKSDVWLSAAIPVPVANGN